MYLHVPRKTLIRNVRNREMRFHTIIFVAFLLAGCCTHPKRDIPDYSSLKAGMTLSEARSAIGITPWHWQGNIYSKPVHCFDSDGASAIVAIDHSVPEGRIIWVNVDRHGKTISAIRQERQKRNTRFEQDGFTIPSEGTPSTHLDVR